MIFATRWARTGCRPVRAVVHKYPDRVLFLAADHCAVYCRHCTRRRITGGDEGAFDRDSAAEGIAYVRAHPEVRDVIVSGGDPLALADERIGWLLEALRAIPHVQILRLATRAPVVNPMRVTDGLAAFLRRLAPLFVVTHFNHPKECTDEARAACERLVDRGVPVENQTVLLRRVNSTPRTIADLNQRLLAWRVRPYYLHQGDLAEGTAHLRTPLATGLGDPRAAARPHQRAWRCPTSPWTCPEARGRSRCSPAGCWVPGTLRSLPRWRRGRPRRLVGPGGTGSAAGAGARSSTPSPPGPIAPVRTTRSSTGRRAARREGVSG